VEGNNPAKEKIQTQCVINCIGKIRLFGFKSRYDQAMEDNPLDYLIHIKKVALPLYPQFGLEPNVYYIPPINAPDKFNLQLFGPNAFKAIASYRRAYEDKKLIAILMLIGSSDKIFHSFKVEGDIEKGFCYAYNEKGEEIVKVPLKEPIHIRKEFDEERNVRRFNVT
jgi:nitrate reductase beta subunit